MDFSISFVSKNIKYITAKKIIYLLKKIIAKTLIYNIIFYNIYVNFKTRTVFYNNSSFSKWERF